MPGMRVGLYGGSFDPAHGGHWHVAETARVRLGLDRVWWLVSPQNPLKETRAGDYQRRLAGVRALVGRRPRHVVSDIEARQGLFRTVDTVRWITMRSRGVKFVWLMGGDNLASFHHWAAWREIAQSVAIAVIARPRIGAIGGLPQFSRAAYVMARQRIDQSNARLAVVRAQNCWVYLPAKLNFTSSTALRAKA